MESENVQLIFCVETSKNAKTDVSYINAVLGKYYNVGENKITYVYMNGKYNYNHDDTIKDIENMIKDYQVGGGGESYVIYVCDKDLNTQDPRDNAFVKDLKKYCKANGYKLIWFVKTIEDVMWSEIIKKNKKKKAEQFLSQNRIDKVKKSHLSAGPNVNAPGKSNILHILNSFKEIQ